METTEIRGPCGSGEDAFHGPRAAQQAVSWTTGQQTSPELKREKEKELKKQNIQKPWDNFKKYNIHITGLSEEKREKVEEIFEVIIMAPNFPKLMTDPRKLRIPSRFNNPQNPHLGKPYSESQTNKILKEATGREKHLQRGKKITVKYLKYERKKPATLLPCNCVFADIIRQKRRKNNGPLRRTELTDSAAGDLLCMKC